MRLRGVRRDGRTIARSRSADSRRFVIVSFAARRAVAGHARMRPDGDVGVRQSYADSGGDDEAFHRTASNGMQCRVDVAADAQVNVDGATLRESTSVSVEGLIDVGIPEARRASPCSVWICQAAGPGAAQAATAPAAARVPAPKVATASPRAPWAPAAARASAPAKRARSTRSLAAHAPAVRAALATGGGGLGTKNSGAWRVGSTEAQRGTGLWVMRGAEVLARGWRLGIERLRSALRPSPAHSTSTRLRASSASAVEASGGAPVKVRWTTSRPPSAPWIAPSHRSGVGGSGRCGLCVHHLPRRGMVAISRLLPRSSREDRNLCARKDDRGPLRAPRATHRGVAGAQARSTALEGAGADLGGTRDIDAMADVRHAGAARKACELLERFPGVRADAQRARE